MFQKIHKQELLQALPCQHFECDVIAAPALEERESTPELQNFVYYPDLIQTTQAHGAQAMVI